MVLIEEISINAIFIEKRISSFNSQNSLILLIDSLLFYK